VQGTRHLSGGLMVQRVIVQQPGVVRLAYQLVAPISMLNPERYFLKRIFHQRWHFMLPKAVLFLSAAYDPLSPWGGPQRHEQYNAVLQRHIECHRLLNPSIHQYIISIIHCLIRFRLCSGDKVIMNGLSLFALILSPSCCTDHLTVLIFRFTCSFL
jgi:hypothetical protein